MNDDLWDKRIDRAFDVVGLALVVTLLIAVWFAIVAGIVEGVLR